MLFWPLFTCIKNHKWFGLGFLRYYIPIQNKSVNRPINRSQSSRAIIKSEKFTMLSLFEENTPNTGKILLSKLKNLINIRCGSWIRAHIILSERRRISNEHIYICNPGIDTNTGPLARGQQKSLRASKSPGILALGATKKLHSPLILCTLRTWKTRLKASNCLKLLALWATTWHQLVSSPATPCQRKHNHSGVNQAEWFNLITIYPKYYGDPSVVKHDWIIA